MLISRQTTRCLEHLLLAFLNLFFKKHVGVQPVSRDYYNQRSSEVDEGHKV